MFNWELERQKQHQKHIREKDEERKKTSCPKNRLKRKCTQQTELEEHVRKTIRQEEQHEETNETVDNGLSQIG